ncbi:hypothetical protein RRG08_050886 [Elysia crispata]|uniref:Uncharacterized protein n=1 Tax=Elysia crispata TaxID=231223 RepID=A0AAE1DE46_9GAST|nr:hypothetical protein RRG08_050886 [Elysia crispata]
MRQESQVDCPSLQSSDSFYLFKSLLRVLETHASVLTRSKPQSIDLVIAVRHILQPFGASLTLTSVSYICGAM